MKGSAASFVVLEARGRVGGRGHTVTIDGHPLDLGCGWLHSARQNSWAGVAQSLGLKIDSSPPAWARPALNFPPEEQRAYRKAFGAFEDRLDAAAHGPDRPASDLFAPEDARWRPLLDVFSGIYNGASFEEISVKDYAAYQPTEDNWRVVIGYGALMTAFAADLPVILDCPVTLLDRRNSNLRLLTAKGVLQARSAIVCVPTSVLAEEGLRIDPPLPDKIDAAGALPLGNVDKVFLHLEGAGQFDPDTRVLARTDTTDTGGYTLRPMGMPVVEAYFGGRVAARLEQEGPGAFGAFARQELVEVFGSEFGRRLRPLVESRWSADPFSRGAYSHARPGFSDRRAVLSAPVENRLFFAGEACSPHAFSTAHGAYDTGVAAAEAALEAVGEPVRMARRP
ncbi:MAG: FAD-dependent oxidoreductase [Caulobacteraceae bacterium]|nr:FAD-dependent oxidoreductase [Caulobacteraceae bacterium]